MGFDLGRYKRITVEPLTGSIGADIRGVDVTNIDDATFAEIRQAFLDHQVIVIRDQELTPEALTEFSSRFGPLAITPHAKAVDGDGYIVRFNREADVPRTKRNLGDRWHADQSPREHPNMAAVLYCTEAPPYGGDTLFSNLCMAYDWLSPAMQKLCDGLVALHSRAAHYGPDGMGTRGATVPLLQKGTDGGYHNKYYRLDDEALAYVQEVMEHPLVCTHPDTGRPILYVTGDYMWGIRGMSDLESSPLIDYLNQHAIKPEFSCRVRWTKGALTIWDNRCTQHYAVNDYEGFARRMLRLEIDGGRPFGPAMPQDETAALAQNKEPANVL